MHQTADTPPSYLKGPRLNAAGLRRLNLFFIFNIATAPLPTSRIITDVDLGYGKAAPKSEMKKFERDRSELRKRGIYIKALKAPGAAMNEERLWELDRSAAGSPYETLSLDELDYLLSEVQRLTTNPFWRNNAAMVELESSLKVELAGRLGSRVPHAVTSADEVQNLPTCLDALWGCLDERKTAHFTYQDSQGSIKSFDVDIYGFFQQENNLYLAGFDHKAGFVKSFRCSRILHMDAGRQESYHIPADFDLTSCLFLPFDFSSNAPMDAVFSFPPSISRLELASLTHGRGELLFNAEQERYELCISVRDLEAAALWALSHASMGMRPLSPAPLIKAWRASILKAVSSHV